MKDQDKSKKQLMDELVKLRQQYAELEKTEIGRKEAEEALKENQERYEALFNHSLCCVCVHDFEGRILDLNKAALKLLGYSKKELLSLSLFSIIEEDKLSGATKTSIKIKKKKFQNKHSEYKLRKKDGSWIWVETEASVIYREGKPYAILRIGRDISARKRTEEELRETKNRLQSLFEGIPVGLYRSTPEGKRLEVNRALLRVAGNPNREAFLKGNVINDYVNPEDRKKWQAKMEREGTVRDFEAQCRQNDGSVIWIRDSARTVRDSEGRTLYYEGAVDDITERKEAEEKEKQYASNLAFLSKSAMEFVELPPRSDIYKFIGRRLKEIVDNSFVLVNSFDETTQCLKVKAFSGVRKEIESVLKILGQNPIGRSFPISEEARAGLSTGRLVKVPGGLYVLSFEKIPKHICNTLEKLFNVGNIYTMGFLKEGKIFGNAVIITRNKDGLEKRDLIETFIGQASVALQRRRVEEIVKRYREHLEELVEEGTADLKSANEKLMQEIAERKKVEEALKESESKLQKQKLALEQKNIALREIIAQIEVEKRKIKNDIETNINVVVSPILKKLEIEKAPLKYVDLLQNHLRNLTSSFGYQITEKNLNLTPREIEICNMIKGGLTSKDISNLLSISYRTVEKHRRNIRQKIGISNKNINLASYLHNL